MSTLKVNSIEPANAGSEDYFLARAWVNFNGTGTVAIRADGNVSSVTDNGTGDYTLNFTTNFSDANYATVNAVGGTGSSQPLINLGTNSSGKPASILVGSVRVYTINDGNSSADYQNIHVAAVR